MKNETENGYKEIKAEGRAGFKTGRSVYLQLLKE